jgi:hypothetical protein
VLESSLPGVRHERVCDAKTRCFFHKPLEEATSCTRSVGPDLTGFDGGKAPRLCGSKMFDWMQEVFWI